MAAWSSTTTAPPSTSFRPRPRPPSPRPHATSESRRPRLVAREPRERHRRHAADHRGRLHRPDAVDPRVKGPGMSRWLSAAHEQAALGGLVAIALHGVALLGDPFLKPGVPGIAVPF